MRDRERKSQLVVGAVEVLARSLHPSSRPRGCDRNAGPEAGIAQRRTVGRSRSAVGSACRTRSRRTRPRLGSARATGGPTRSRRCALRSELHRRGLRFRKDFLIRVDGVQVRPDIVFTQARVAVFVDGCFWHGCPEHQVVPEVQPRLLGSEAPPQRRAGPRGRRRPGWRGLDRGPGLGARGRHRGRATGSRERSDLAYTVWLARQALAESGEAHHGARRTRRSWIRLASRGHRVLRRAKARGVKVQVPPPIRK